jgi:hypothetical protein
MEKVIRFLPKAIAIVILISMTGCAQKLPYLLVTEQARLLKVDLARRSDIVLEGPGPVRAMHGELFILRKRQIVISDMSGKECRRISVPDNVLYIIDFVVVPDGRLALLDNRNDAIYFVSTKGKHLKTVNFLDEPDRHLQNMDGVVVGNKLIVSENGNNQLLAVDLSTYQVSIFRDLTNIRGPLGAIIYDDGTYYLCKRKAIYAFSEDSDDVKKIATTPEGNLTGIAIVQGRLLVVTNGMSRITEKSLAAKRRTTEGVLYEINPQTGEVKIIREGLNYPQGLNVIR